MTNFEKNFNNDDYQETHPQLQIKIEILPEDNQKLSELSKETGISKGVYQTLYGLYKQAQIVNQVDDFIQLAQQPGFDFILQKVQDPNMRVEEFLSWLGSKSAGEIAKEEENFKKLMGDEDKG
jgi:hypothetical protein